jgi:hypothetical protein
VVDTGLCGKIMLSVIRQTEGDAYGPPGSTWYWHFIFYDTAV